MNTSVRINDLSRWQMCVGMCVICGQPLGLGQAAARSSGVKTAELGEEGDEESALLESLSLSEECPVRLCMMRFRMLGKREECHIVDRYTHLEKDRSEDNFEKVFGRHKDAIQNVNEAYVPFETELPGLLGAALATCRRVAKPLTFSGCRACNLAMDKSSAHANAVYRCFPLTSDADIPELEENTQESIKVKKVLQQIALFFEWQAGQGWTVKNGDRLLQDTCLWRCIAHLYCWGRDNKFRSRLVAIFHASNYMFQRSSYKGSVTLEDWHIHIFQPYYMQTYEASTWFGVSHGEIAASIDFSRKDGARWVDFVQAKLELTALELWAEREIKLSSIQAFKDRFLASVSNEKQLIRFAKHGLDKLFSFFIFSLKGKTERGALEHCTRFLKELGRVTTA